MAGPRLPGRTYNQDHIPRKYTRGKRRVSIYWTWSYPWEANRNTAERDKIGNDIGGDGVYHRFTKDEANMTIRHEKSTNLLATYSGSLPGAMNRCGSSSP